MYRTFFFFFYCVSIQYRHAKFRDTMLYRFPPTPSLVVWHSVKPVCIISKRHISSVDELEEDPLPEGDHHSSTETVIH